MVASAILGFPRFGRRRALKTAVEGYWAGRIAREQLEAEARRLRADHWGLMQARGIAVIPSNDFSFYDQMLDTTLMLGAVPDRFAGKDPADLDTLFALARGITGAANEESGCGHDHGSGKGAVAMEMTKWFDTNYHYLVPELKTGMAFRLSTTKAVDQFLEARALGIHTRPVVIGPLTWLLLGKARGEAFDVLSLLDRVLPVYEELLGRLGAAGADWVQIDEPILVTDLTDAQRAAFGPAYRRLSAAGPKLMVATYFEGLRDNTATACALPVAGLHVDLVRAPDQLAGILPLIGADKILSLGVIDGRNIWRADLDAALERAQPALAALGVGRVQIAPSCSLLHVPLDLADEQRLDADLKSWLAFAVQKIEEVALLANAAAGQRDEAAFGGARAAAEARRTSPRIHNPMVKQRLAAVTADMAKRPLFAERVKEQEIHLNLPAFPTTTIGSFPQTKDVREQRAALKKGTLTQDQYDAFIAEAIAESVRWQEQLDVDVLVHGEFERNDMVEYFGELMDGYAFTDHGWVQSYGSRGVKPPIIFGDVARPEPMTVRWSAYAKSLTDRPMKGMLSGPITMLQWSFVRDDQPRSETARQIALALRDEVVDLERAGIAVIQVDEPAFREGLPLRAADRPHYLAWAVEAFRLATSGVQPRTQIHTHMCYAEFNDIIDSIAALDADVISIETSRSDMDLLDAFTRFSYPNQIGPGVWDIHSPRVPAADEMERLLDKALKVLRPDQIWVNPDCGLKTRGWAETRAAMANLVAAAKALRAKRTSAAA